MRRGEQIMGVERDVDYRNIWQVKASSHALYASMCLAGAVIPGLGAVIPGLCPETSQPGEVFLSRLVGWSG